MRNARSPGAYVILLTEVSATMEAEGCLRYQIPRLLAAAGILSVLELFDRLDFKEYSPPVFVRNQHTKTVHYNSQQHENALDGALQPITATGLASIACDHVYYVCPKAPPTRAKAKAVSPPSCPKCLGLHFWNNGTYRPSLASEKNASHRDNDADISKFIRPGRDVICVCSDRHVVEQFFSDVVPLIKVPFTLVTLGNDNPMPPRPKLLDTVHLMRWYSWNTGYTPAQVPCTAMICDVPENFTAGGCKGCLKGITNPCDNCWRKALYNDPSSRPLVHPALIPVPIGLSKVRMWQAMAAALAEPPKAKNGRILANFGMYEESWRKSLWSMTKRWEFVDRVDRHQAKVLGWIPADTPFGWNPDPTAQFYGEVAKYSFALCPKGYGEDTHRVWEALYLRVVPIVLRSGISSVYNGLPVVQLDDWTRLDNREFVAELLARPAPNWEDLSQLDVRYWAARIRSGV